MKENSFDDELFGFFKGLYETEFARRDKLSERVSFGISLLTLLGGLVVYYISSFKPASYTQTHLWFYVPLALGVVLMAISLVYFFLAMYHGWNYDYISAEGSRQYIEDLRVRNSPLTPGKENQIRDLFVRSVTDDYLACTKSNSSVNETRQKRILCGSVLAVWSLAVLLLASAPFFVLKSGFHDEPQRVTIVNPVEVKHGR
jgi:peptidoglycan biosynthesis protein MviN/MurJ (putative lipid II flippase)